MVDSGKPTVKNALKVILTGGDIPSGSGSRGILYK